MRHGDAINLREGYTVKFVSKEEHSIAHVLKFEIRTEFVFIHRILRLLCLVGIVTPVPTHGFKVLTFLLDFSLDVIQFFVCLFNYRGPHLFKKFSNRFFILCHTCFESKLSIVTITHQLCLLNTCFNEFTNNFFIVIFVIVVATVRITFIHLLTKFTIFRILQERHHTGIVKCKEPLSFLTSRRSCFCGIVNKTLGKTSKVFFIVNKELESICFCQHILTKGQLKEGYFTIQLTELCLSERI